MRRALLLAARGRGRVEPNPMVGCVIVRNGRVVGEGYHHRFGGPHAEVDALRKTGSAARGATCYVTLEPCCHFGKTPPCTEALLTAGVKRVVIAMRDPFPKVKGKGLRRLRSAGIAVSVGLMESETIRLNGPYLKLQRQGRPWVILKWAQSLDGKIATRTSDSRWISCEQSQVEAHRLRGRVDAVVVGVGTVVADDPLLTCRHVHPKRIATRLVIDPTLRMPLSAKLVRTAGDYPTLVATDRMILKGRRAAALGKAGIELIGLRRNRAGSLDLVKLLEVLGSLHMTNIMVEGGGRTLGEFHDAGLADEAMVVVAPRLIGGRAAISPLSGVGPATIMKACEPVDVEVRNLGPDHVFRLLLTDPASH